jgi:lipoyl(octanoyl) transferase
VITLGRLASEEDVILPEVYEEVPLIRTNRGGDITVHSPGQLLIYPVIDISRSLRSLSGYIDLLEEFAVRALNEEGVKAQRTSRRGVWVGGKKIAFIGVSAKRWVTYHGIAVNINNDLNLFNGINPCGENDIKVTSVYEETGKEADIPSMKKLFIEKFKETFSEWTEKTR